MRLGGRNDRLGGRNDRLGGRNDRLGGRNDRLGGGELTLSNARRDCEASPQSLGIINWKLAGKNWKEIFLNFF